MRKPHCSADSAFAGFTLVEALIATALMVIVLGAVATISSTWLPNWNHGISRLQRNEHIALGLERITADIAAAEFLSATNNTQKPLFDGTPHSITFVRTALGPNASRGLEIVRIAELRTPQGPIIVRTRAPLLPLANNKAFQFQPSGDPVVLLRAPYSLSVAYSGADRLWHPTWQQQVQLPKAVKLTVRHNVTNQILPFSTTVLLHSGIPADCIDAKTFADCLLRLLPTTTSDKLISEKHDG